MTANRDPVIWAAAHGKSIKPVDANVPAPLAVKTNVGGGSRSSSKEKEGSTNYLSPEESLERIKVPEGFELNIFASEEMFPDSGEPRTTPSRWEGATLGGQLEFVPQVAAGRRTQRQLDDL